MSFFRVFPKKTACLSGNFAAVSAWQTELEMKDGVLSFHASPGTGGEALLFFGPLSASLYIDAAFQTRFPRPDLDKPYEIFFPDGVLFEPGTVFDAARLLELLPARDDVMLDQAQCALLQGEPKHALDLLLPLPDSEDKTNLLVRAVRQAFSLEKKQAMVDAIAGDRAAALDRMAAVPALYAHIFAPKAAPQIAPHPTTQLPTDPPHVAIIGDLSLPQCRHYRVDQKAEQLQSLGVKISVFSRQELTAFEAVRPSFSHVICYRLPLVPAVFSAIAATKAAGIPMLYETDDLLFDSVAFPGPKASYGADFSEDEYAELQVLPPLYLAAMALCDGVITSTSALKSAISKALPGTPVHIHANALGRQHRTAQELARGNTLKDTDIVELFYGTGTRALQSDFDDFAENCLAPLLKAQPGVRLTLMGYLDLPAVLTPFSGQIRHRPLGALGDYWQALASADINLAPLEINHFNDCKSAIKWLEAAMFGVPTIASGTAGFLDAVTHSKTGMLCKNWEEWRAALTELVENPSLREALGSAAKMAAEQHYSEDGAAQNIDHILAISKT